MNYKIVPNYIVMIMAVIIGVALVNQIDFKMLAVKKPALAIVYSIALLICIGFMIKKKKK